MDSTEDTALPVAAPRNPLTSGDAGDGRDTDADTAPERYDPGDDGSDGSTWELMQDEGRWPSWL